MISVVVCSNNSLRSEAIERHYRAILGESPFEFILMESPASLSAGYNEGLARSQGDIVAFSHDDIEFLTPNFADKLTAHMERFDVVGVAGTDRLAGPNWFAAGPPHLFGQVLHPADRGYELNVFGAPRPVVGAIQALDGVFVAFRREVIEQVRWDEGMFDGFHLYDLDCTFRAFEAGFRLAVACDLPIYHASKGSYGSEDWKRYAQKFIVRHGARLARPGAFPAGPAWVRVPDKKAATPFLIPPYWESENASAK